MLVLIHFEGFLQNKYFSIPDHMQEFKIKLLKKIEYLLFYTGFQINII